ncbi:hypothetical protein BT96DRAFT_928274 [Gymnopus androsaceus JB14]|uniref:Uncharacterized protein n=1 Tax=Gymnopus androsaceus JB14 TaxID=1447944 RepID=A0A6A4GM16_9AGAR|nr:hypothetical protein BT96DRAFT_928274 [Gymnopus androsaceus JB14]
MPLRTKPKRTNAEVLQERLNTNEALRKLFESDLDKHHFARLSDPTLRNHAMVMKHYREYSEYTRQLFNEGKSTVQPETPEIAIGTAHLRQGLCPLPGLGFARTRRVHFHSLGHTQRLYVHLHRSLAPSCQRPSV